MSSRQRQSTAPQRRLATVDVPEYQSLQHPLTPTAQRALSVLSQTHALSKLKVHLKEANVTLTEAAGLINDRHTLRLDTQRKEERRRAKQGNLPDEPNNKRDRQLETLQSKVDKLTRRMEEGVRKIIDGQAVVTNLEETLRSATNLSSDVLPQHSQRRRQNEQRSEDEDEEMTDFEPTDPRASSRSGEVRGPSESFRQRLQMGRDRYQFLSLRTRYAENNDYIGFRRTIHDAQHPEEDAPPLPNPSTWFTEKGAPAAGLTLPSQAEGDATGNASDDDIAIARERISTKCPLTLQEFREPLTSRRCPHTFEKDAIMGLLHQSRVGAGGTSRRDFANGQQTVQCPVAGCSEVRAAASYSYMTMSDLLPVQSDLCSNVFWTIANAVLASDTCGF